MLMRSTLAALALLTGVAGAQAQTKTEVVMQYPFPELFTETHKQIAEEFAKVRPDIKVTMRAPYESYEDATQRVLREAVTNQMPDVSFQGLNRIRVLVDKNIPAPLDGYIAAEKDFDKQGFHQAMFDIGTASAATVIVFNIDISIVAVAPEVYLMPVIVMPSMNRRWASRKATTSGAMMTMAAAISGP